jgi:hypothetical protein
LDAQVLLYSFGVIPALVKIRTSGGQNISGDWIYIGLAKEFVSIGDL